MVIEKESDQIAQLMQAVFYAVEIINSYQRDIRDSEWTGVNLTELGFCQGRIYKHAVSDIMKMAGSAQAEKQKAPPLSNPL